jgi:hypothetical protein
MVFQERQDRLREPLTVDARIVAGALLDQPDSSLAGTLPAGTSFSSYLVQFDPVQQPSGLSVNALGSIEFEAEILAVIYDASSLSTTDSLLGSVGNYGPGDGRGLLLGTSGVLQISPDRKFLNFDLTVDSNQSLQFRVLTTIIESADFNSDGRVTMYDLGVWIEAFGKDFRGDADGDGDTDGRDFLVWQRDFVATPLDPDFNNDRIVDDMDLTLWQSAYGLTAFADADGDGDTDGRDFLAWQRAFVEVSADFDGSGRVDEEDLTIWQAAFGTTAGGDANKDGQTNGLDFLIWQRQFTTASFAPADFDRNSAVDSQDLALWQAAFGLTAGGDADGDADSDGRDFLAWQRAISSASPSLNSQISVPEPSCLVHLAGLVAVCAALRRRHLNS